MKKVIKYLQKIKRAWHREILDPFLLLLFASAEDSVCNASNSKPVFAEEIVSNYFQGMVLFGRDKKDKIYWYRKDRLYWQITKFRGVILPDKAHLSRRLKAYMSKELFEIRYDSDVESVIRACQDRNETWINEELIGIYKILEKQGYVRTIETYLDGQLVGGLWGIVLGKTFSLMSMFHQVDKAGVIAMGELIQRLQKGEFGMIDCGVNNDTFMRYGAITVTRDEFIRFTVQNLNK